MNKEIENITNAMTWALNYINEYRSGGAFDPFAALAGTSDRKQKLFIESVAYLQELEEITERYRNTRERVVRELETK